MLEQPWQLHVIGIGSAQVLTIARFHEYLGLSRKACIEQLLGAPALLKDNLTKSEGDQLVAALSEVGLAVELSQSPLETTSRTHELAAYITQVDHLPAFAAELAAFTGQDAETVVDSLSKTPAMILGGLSASVAEELAKRFSKPGIEVIASNPETANFTIVAYNTVAEGGASGLETHYSRLGLARSSHSDDVWESVDVPFAKAQEVWQAANELRLPLTLQNHDLMRFDVHLLGAADTQSSSLRRVLHEQCGIPTRLHEKVLERLPVLIDRCLPLGDAQALLALLEQAGADAEAVSLSGCRFNLHLDNWRGEYSQPLAGLCQRILRRAIPISDSAGAQLELPIGANLHQTLWIKHECDQMGLKSQLLRAA